MTLSSPLRFIKLMIQLHQRSLLNPRDIHIIGFRAKDIDKLKFITFFICPDRIMQGDIFTGFLQDYPLAWVTMASNTSR